MAMAMAILVLVLIFISYQIVSSINAPLKQLISDLSRLASSKDIIIRRYIEVDNEISYVANAFNILRESFEQTLSFVRERIVSMGKTAHGMSTSMSEFVSLINNQKCAIDEISVFIYEITTSITRCQKYRQIPLRQLGAYNMLLASVGGKNV